MSRSLKAHLLLVLVTFIWGATFVVVKDSLNNASPLLYNAVRMTVAAIVLAAIFYRQLNFSREVTQAIEAMDECIAQKALQAPSLAKSFAK